MANTKKITSALLKLSWIIDDLDACDEKSQAMAERLKEVLKQIASGLDE
jgi:hypothetical protein